MKKSKAKYTDLKKKSEKGSDEYNYALRRENRIKSLEKELNKRVKDYELNNYTLPFSKFRSLTTSLKFYEILYGIELIIHISADEDTLNDIYNNVYNIKSIGRSEDFVNVTDAEFVELYDELPERQVKSEYSAYLNLDAIRNRIIRTRLNDCYSVLGTKYTLNKLDRRMTGQHYSDALNYQITMPDGTKLFPGNNIEKQSYWNWRWSQSKVQWGIDNGFIVFKQIKGNWAVYFKQYFKVNNKDELIQRAQPYQNLIKELDGINSARGTQEVMGIFNSKKFDYPKPINLLKYLLNVHANKNSKILDFFAGSGTTAQAVLELNKEDGGNRKFILCTNNENGICENITYQRIKTVITGKREDGSDYSDGIPANLKYYRTDFVSKNEEYLSYTLLEHVAEMIQLEHGIKLDGKRYITVMNDDEADRLAEHWSEYPDVKALYVSKNVLFTTEQNALFKDADIHIIPDYYFNFELREVGETW